MWQVHRDAVPLPDSHEDGLSARPAGKPCPVGHHCGDADLLDFCHAKHVDLASAKSKWHAGMPYAPKSTPPRKGLKKRVFRPPFWDIRTTGASRSLTCSPIIIFAIAALASLDTLLFLLPGLLCSLRGSLGGRRELFQTKVLPVALAPEGFENHARHVIRMSESQFLHVLGQR